MRGSVALPLASGMPLPPPSYPHPRTPLVSFQKVQVPEASHVNNPGFAPILAGQCGSGNVSACVLAMYGPGVYIILVSVRNL